MIQINTKYDVGDTIVIQGIMTTILSLVINKNIAKVLSIRYVVIIIEKLKDKKQSHE